jgi:hypothetical protein
MTITYKVLGQTATTAAYTTQTVYTVPGTRLGAVVSTINVCNLSTVSNSFNIAVVTSGTTLTTSSYINYFTPIPGNDSIAISIGVTLATNDSLQVYSPGSAVTFAVFGSEIS